MENIKKSIELDYNLQSYNYELPEKNIAQYPAENRDEARLLAINRATDTYTDLNFSDILQFIKPGDLLVVNDTKVFPARIIGQKETGGRIELFLLEHPQIAYGNGSMTVESKLVDDGQEWYQSKVTGLLKSSKKPKLQSKLLFGDRLYGIVDELLEDGKVQVLLNYKGKLDEILSEYGQVPLPPYIRRESQGYEKDSIRYQTVYAKQTGAVAAPTAGLHFTEKLLQQLRRSHINIASITLHVGYGTFAPVRTTDIRNHRIHQEYVIISSETAQMINNTRRKNGKIWAVGTTTARALEYGADENHTVHKTEGWCDLYILPGYKFKVVDNLITNFHLPGSSLLFLVSAMVGREKLLAIYEYAIKSDYRFYSYGDAMAIIT